MKKNMTTNDRQGTCARTLIERLEGIPPPARNAPKRRPRSAMSSGPERGTDVVRVGPSRSWHGDGDTHALRPGLLGSVLAAMAAAPAAAQVPPSPSSATVGQADESVGDLSRIRPELRRSPLAVHAAGYKLTGVDLGTLPPLRVALSYAVSIWTNGRFGWPGASLGTLTSPTTLACQRTEFLHHSWPRFLRLRFPCSRCWCWF